VAGSGDRLKGDASDGATNEVGLLVIAFEMPPLRPSVKHNKKLPGGEKSGSQARSSR